MNYFERAAARTLLSRIVALQSHFYTQQVTRTPRGRVIIVYNILYYTYKKDDRMHYILYLHRVRVP